MYTPSVYKHERNIVVTITSVRDQIPYPCNISSNWLDTTHRNIQLSIASPESMYALFAERGKKCREWKRHIREFFCAIWVKSKVSEHALMLGLLISRLVLLSLSRIESLFNCCQAAATTIQFKWFATSLLMYERCANVDADAGIWFVILFCLNSNPFRLVFLPLF